MLPCSAEKRLQRCEKKNVFRLLLVYNSSMSAGIGAAAVVVGKIGSCYICNLFGGSPVFAYVAIIKTTEQLLLWCSCVQMLHSAGRILAVFARMWCCRSTPILHYSFNSLFKNYH